MSFFVPSSPEIYLQGAGRFGAVFCLVPGKLKFFSKEFSFSESNLWRHDPSEYWKAMEAMLTWDTENHCVDHAKKAGFTRMVGEAKQKKAKEDERNRVACDAILRLGSTSSVGTTWHWITS